MIPPSIDIALDGAEDKLRGLAEERDRTGAMDSRLETGREEARAALSRLKKVLGTRLHASTVEQIAAALSTGPCPFGSTLRKWADTIAQIGDQIDRETPRGAA